MCLRPYQVRSLPALRAQYAAGHRAVLYVLPTGGGKTAVAAAIMALAVSSGKRVLFLAHRRELIAQAVVTLGRHGITGIRTIRAAVDTGPADARVTVASVQTVVGEQWVTELPDADFIIVDEAHHVRARTWQGLLGRYPAAKVLGLTATPQRGDGRPLGDVFQALVVGATVKELTELEHLVPCRAWSPPEILEPGELALTVLDAYRTRGGGTGSVPADLAAQLADPERTQDARGVLRDWYEENGWGRAVVFCSDVKHAEAVRDELHTGAVPAEVVHGKLRDRVRADILERFVAGELRAVCNVACLTEGWDDPGVSVAILARRFGHAGEFLQAVGRVLRPAGGSKTHATLVDLCGSVLKHGTPDAERKYTLDGVGIERSDRQAIRQCAACGAVFPAGPNACPLCGTALPKVERKEPRSVGAGLVDVSDKNKQEHQQLLRNLRAAAHGGAHSAGWIERAAAVISTKRFAWR